MLTYFLHPTFTARNIVYLVKENELYYGIFYLHPWWRWPDQRGVGGHLTCVKSRVYLS